MGSWQLAGTVILTIIVVSAIGVGGFFIRHMLKRQQWTAQRLLETKQAAAEKAAAEKAAAEKAAAETSMVARAAAERLAAKRAAIERAAAERAAAEQAAVEQAIGEWASAEQAEAERTHMQRADAARQEAEESEARMQAVEQAIAEWIQAEREGNRLAVATTPGKAGKRTYTRTEAIHQQVRLTATKVAKEMQELEFIKNRIQTGVDFLPIEVRLTIDQWKAGQIYRRHTFDDLKLKFRFKAYSIEDGYELLYFYSDWIAQQRQKLRVFIRLLGTNVDALESIQAAIERAEHAEQEKYLEMDVDAIFTLRDIRDILDKLISVETILRELEDVCRKRAAQVITPSWEAKGSL